MAGGSLLDDLLADYARSTGLGALPSDAAGVVALSFNDRLVLHFTPGLEADDAVLYARLARAMPADGREALLSRMLEANLVGDRLGGGCLALDARDGAPMLVSRVRLPGLTAVAFADMVASFAAAGQAWADQLSMVPAQAAQTGPDPAFLRV